MGAKVIFHRCTAATAYRIAHSGQMWSKDPLKQANFHWNRRGGANECGNEITLEFEWSGPIIYGQSSISGNPGELIEVTPNGPDVGAWLLALLPGTMHGLRLVGMSHPKLSKVASRTERAHLRHLLSQVLRAIEGFPAIRVPHPYDRIMVQCPSQRGLWQRLRDAASLVD